MPFTRDPPRRGAPAAALLSCQRLPNLLSTQASGPHWGAHQAPFKLCLQPADWRRPPHAPPRPPAQALHLDFRPRAGAHVVCMRARLLISVSGLVMSFWARRVCTRRAARLRDAMLHAYPPTHLDRPRCPRRVCTRPSRAPGSMLQCFLPPVPNRSRAAAGAACAPLISSHAPGPRFGPAAAPANPRPREPHLQAPAPQAAFRTPPPALTLGASPLIDHTLLGTTLGGF
ncbi:MAG: hypothetical protein J3K34DRAFT_206853 [Monoraphidium minutum]|nr:MAG: hypothetical protein J3K34DRAFT_206853 [Monoraphidium minutum]